jgi:5-methylthioadenosine/S-adenosylhomocysteine deaminase
LIERPVGVVIDGHLQLGLELVISDGVIAEIRPHTGLPEPYILSAAFVNTHSHLEYRGMEGQFHSEDYFDWIREITVAKVGQSPEQVREDCLLAAKENFATGVRRIGEHSDRPFAAEALSSVGIDGIIFQELITFFEQADAATKIDQVQSLAALQRETFGGAVALALHTAYTVDRETLAFFGGREGTFSIHVAESRYENEFFRSGTGPIADFYSRNGVPFVVTGGSVVELLRDLGLVRPSVQFVHCCDLSSSDIEILASGSVPVAHCPRSNVRLKCPPAPVREMLDAGLKVGLGMDSAASSGPIDMFAEMRSALEVSAHRGRPLLPEEVWRMATVMGDASLPLSVDRPKWDIYVGSRTPLIKMALPGAQSVEDLIAKGEPGLLN